MALQIHGKSMINTKQSAVDGIGQSATYIQKDLTRNLPYSGLPNQSQVGKKLKEKSKTIKLVEENNEKKYDIHRWDGILK